MIKSASAIIFCLRTLGAFRSVSVDKAFNLQERSYTGSSTHSVVK
jgi:hypothetical protein